MKRKDFLLTSLTATPLIAFPRLTEMQSEGPSKPFVVVAGASRRGETIKFLGMHPNDCKISGKDTGGQLSVFEYTGLDKVGPMLHLHYHQDEIFTVIEGKYRFVAGTDTYELQAGDTIFLPRNIPHTWIQLSDKGKLIYFLQPAGKMEEFFSIINELKEKPAQQELDQLHEAHGMKVVGPPLSL
jgi:quercetin dioxygenase-like cupin family protein